MSLLKLDVFAVRNLQKLSFIPSQAINFIFGANASGKSALLEAIYILGRAKSFRSNTIKSIIQFDQPQLTISASLMQPGNIKSQLGVQLDGKDTIIRINQQSVHSRSDLAYTFPVQLIHPKSFELLDAGPLLRREFLDWGAFNMYDGFLPAWQKYKRALAQRNMLLKSKQLDQIYVWDKELVYYGTIVNTFRQQYIQAFLPVFIEIFKIFFEFDGVQVTFLSGWDTSKALAQVLMDEREKDTRYGFTHSGPHRGDFQVFINKRLAKDHVSRGQMKLLILSLKLAQIQLLAKTKNKLACILIDDVSAELDLANRTKVLQYLASMKCQVFISAAESADFGDLQQINEYKMFHMEHGNIKQIYCSTWNTMQQQEK